MVEGDREEEEREKEEEEVTVLVCLYKVQQIKQRGFLFL